MLEVEINGVRGARGKSIYDIAVDNGFKGTEAEFLASLKGGKGDTGEPGQKGDTGTAPLIAATKENGVTTLTVDGVTVATISDGVDGKTITSITADEEGCIRVELNDGTAFTTASVKGATGYAPVRGVDYWTAADVEAITQAACQAAIERYPISEEVGF